MHLAYAVPAEKPRLETPVSQTITALTFAFFVAEQQGNYPLAEELSEKIVWWREFEERLAERGKSLIFGYT